MIVIARERILDAPPDALWPLIADAARLPEWLDFGERVEPLGGTGLGRRLRLHGHWGDRQSEVDVIVVEEDAPRRLAWRHEAERLNHRPAPAFARETVFAIEVAPAGTGARVRLESRQQPATWLHGLMIRLMGSRLAGQAMQRSLRRLAAVASVAAAS